MPIEEVISKVFVQLDKTKYRINSNKDLERFFSDNINVKLPLDGPLYRFYIQELYVTETGEKRTIVMMKAHHSLGDGLSMTAMILGCSDEYDRSYFMSGKGETRWW